MEQYTYAMLTVILTGGASKGKEVEASDENINIGKQIETEHVNFGKVIHLIGCQFLIGIKHAQYNKRNVHASTSAGKHLYL